MLEKFLKESNKNNKIIYNRNNWIKKLNKRRNRNDNS